MPLNAGRLLLPCLAFALLVLGGKLLLIAHYGSLTPMHDEWDGVGYQLYRLDVQGRLGWHELLAPFNEHRIVTTRLYELLLLHLDGMVWNPVLQMVLNACLHVAALTGLLYVLLPACPARFQRLFLVLALVLLAVPLAVENTLVGFQSQFYFLMLFSFAGMVLLARASAGSGRWWLGLGSLVLALLSMASGALTLLVAAVFLLLRGWRAGGEARAPLTAALLALLAAVGIALTPAVHTFDEVRAHSPLEFGIALLRVFSWPLVPGCLLVIYLPLVRFLLSQLRRPAAADDVSWLLLLLGLWVLSQLLAICYSRAGMPITSRYVDLFTLGLLLNGLCLLRQEAARTGPPAYLPLVQLWMLAVLGGLIWYGSHVLPFLGQKLVFSPIAEANVRAYLHSHDYRILLNNPYPFIPYAEPGFLKQLLDDPAIVAVLPPNLVPANGAREAGLVVLLVGHVQALAILALAAGGVLLGLYLLRPVAAEP